MLVKQCTHMYCFCNVLILTSMNFNGITISNFLVTLYSISVYCSTLTVQSPD